MSTFCPSAVAQAPVSQVWALLDNPARYDAWMDARIIAVEPPGVTAEGQTIHMQSRAAGMWWPLTLTVTLIEPGRFRIGFSGRFPGGIAMRNTIQCTPVGADRCRIQYG